MSIPFFFKKKRQIRKGKVWCFFRFFSVSRQVHTVLQGPGAKTLYGPFVRPMAHLH